MFTFHHRLRFRWIKGTTKSWQGSKGWSQPQHPGAGGGTYEMVEKMKGKLLYRPAGIFHNNDIRSGAAQGLAAWMRFENSPTPVPASAARDTA